MKWRVVGADRDTGEKREFIIDAPTKQDAEREALKRNAVIAHVGQAGNFDLSTPPAPTTTASTIAVSDDVLDDEETPENTGSNGYHWFWGVMPKRTDNGSVHRLNRLQYPAWGVAHFQPIVIVEISRRAWWQVYWLVVLLAITVPIIVAVVYLLFTFCMGGVLAGLMHDAARSLPRR